MARHEDEPPAADEQTGIEDAPTQAGGEWPVAPQYQVTPEPDFEERPEEEQGTVAVPPLRRRFYGAPLPLVVVALLALLLLAGAAAAWLVTRPESSTASPQVNGAGTANAPTTTPSGGGRGSGATTTTTATSPRTETTETTHTTETRSTTTAAETVSVPDVARLKASAASRRLRAAGLVPRVRLVTSSQDSGTVVDQRPAAHEEVEPRTVVVIEVARKPTPPPPARIAVPRVVGQTAAEAKERLRSLGLRWTITTESSDRESGIVLAQAPAAGAKVEKGGTVTLTVSTGPAEVSVPDVTGLDEEDARARLVSAGFEVDVVDQPTADPGEAGLVLGQEPPSGSSAPEGSTVTITVARTADGDSQ